MRRRFWAGLLAGGLLAVPGAGVAVAAGGGSPANVSLSGDANASPLEVEMVAGSFAKGPLIDARYPHAQADVASGDQATAHGSLLDPGNLVQTLPYEVAANCPPPSPFPQQPPPGGCPQFPAWPFGADADLAHPNASGNVAGSAVGPLAFGAGAYELTVAAGSAAATATGGDATLSAPAALSVTSGSAQATVTALGAEAVSQVTERLQGIKIAGLVDIAAIESTAQVRTAAGAAGQASGRLTVTGVTVAGQAASLDESGLHLLGQSAALPLDPARQALEQLRQAGITVTLLQPQRVANTGYGSYTGAAVAVTLASPQDGSGFTALLGPAGASAVAVPFQGVALGGLPAAGQAPALPLGAATGLPGSGALPPGGPAGGGGTVIHLLGLTLAPRALIIALLALAELALLGAGAAVFWPARVPPPAATLRPLG